jgi:hypothetical protein
MTIGNWDLKWPRSRVLDVFSLDRNWIRQFIIWYHKKIYREISGINIGSDSIIILTILAQLRSYGWWKWTEKEKTIPTFSKARNMIVHHQTGFTNWWSNIIKKIYLEISGINIGSDSAVISTILVQLRSHGWLKCTENEKKCALFPCRRTIRYTNLSIERVILRRHNHWAQDSVLVSAAVSICGLVLGTLRWTLTQQPGKHSHWTYFLYFLRFWDHVQSKRWTGFDLNLVVKILSFSQIFFADVSALCVFFGWHWTSEKIHFFYGKCGIP